MIGATVERLKRGSTEDSADQTEWKFFCLIEDEEIYGLDPATGITNPLSIGEISNSVQIFEIIPNFTNFHFGKIDELHKNGIIITSNKEMKNWMFFSLVLGLFSLGELLFQAE